jgi:hypothetical protein
MVQEKASSGSIDPAEFLLTASLSATRSTHRVCYSTVACMFTAGA